MGIDTPNPFPSELPDSTTSAEASGPSHKPSPSPDLHDWTDLQNMEFAPLPVTHFGHAGMTHSPFDMRHMSNALSGYPQRYHQSQHQSHSLQAASIDPSFTYSPYETHQFTNNLSNQYRSHYSQGLPSQFRPAGGYGTNATANYIDVQNTRSHILIQQQSPYSASMSQNPHYPNYPMHQPTPYGSSGMALYQTGVTANHQGSRPHVDQSQATFGGRNSTQYPQAMRHDNSDTGPTASSALRGPPRKPKQSGHALWVGNLPPGTQITDLKDHFSRDATEDIESVFLISKSNCAFVNYKSVETCASAMNRFHDSRFRGVRLVCRLRRGSQTAVSPASTNAQLETSKSTAPAETTNELLSPTTLSVEQSDTSTTISGSSPGKMAKEKFFVVKSLTVEDLERSVVSGIWATQAHNEENLNAAFESAENVYLIFSANKSGEYFGYARMETEINPDFVAPIEQERPNITQDMAASSVTASVPVTIPTPATNTAPRGHIVDDSARGTIFWEAEHDNTLSVSGIENSTTELAELSGDESSSKTPTTQSTTFGKPFKISWQSTERLPFYRTRGLRNPWNANREVKIARDGTELEPSVGRKLLGLFEQQAQINAAARCAGPPPQFGGYVQQMPQYVGHGMMPPMQQMQYGYGLQGPSQYGRPY